MTSTSAGPPPLSVRVARITPAPRAPRPDDPTPRQPPARLFGGTTLGDLGANKRIVPRPSAGKAKVEDPVLRRAREVMLHLPRSEVPASGSGKGKDKGVRDAVFKVPELPARARRKQGDGGTDVFGAVEPPLPQSANGKGKGKAEDGKTGNALEDANKLVRVCHLARFTCRRMLTCFPGAEKVDCSPSFQCRDTSVTRRVQGRVWFRLPWGFICARKWFCSRSDDGAR